MILRLIIKTRKIPRENKNAKQKNIIFLQARLQLACLAWVASRAFVKRSRRWFNGGSRAFFFCPVIRNIFLSEAEKVSLSHSAARIQSKQSAQANRIAPQGENTHHLDLFMRFKSHFGLIVLYRSRALSSVISVISTTNDNFYFCRYLQEVL